MVNTSKTVALPPKSHAPTAEDISLLESVDVRVAGEGGVTVVDVPIGTYEYVLERAREIVKEGGTDHRALHAASPTCRTNKRWPSMSSNPSGRRLATSKGFSTRSCPSKDARGQTPGRSGHMRISSSCRAQRRHSRFPRRGARMSGGQYNPTSKPKHVPSPSTSFYGSGRVRFAFSGSETNA